MWTDNEDSVEDDNYFIRIIQHGGQRPPPMRALQLPPVMITPPKTKTDEEE